MKLESGCYQIEMARLLITHHTALTRSCPGLWLPLSPMFTGHCGLVTWQLLAEKIVQSLRILPALSHVQDLKLAEITGLLMGRMHYNGVME